MFLEMLKIFQESRKCFRKYGHVSGNTEMFMGNTKNVLENRKMILEKQKQFWKLENRKEPYLKTQYSSRQEQKQGFCSNLIF